MLEVVEVQDRESIEAFARLDLPLHIYEIGDLDPFFWPYTKWYGLRGDDGALRALTLLYSAPSHTVVLAFGRDDDRAIEELIERLRPRLPARFYAHVSPGVADRLRPKWQLEHHGTYLKMVLSDRSKLGPIPVDDVVRLGNADHDALKDLYARAYPDNWFDARMLETGHYFGIRAGDRLACVAGVHVYSPRYRVAALGNVTTDPEHRGRGMARRATAKLCRALLNSVETIGLNVGKDNAAAIACYRCLGFSSVATYDEYMATSG